MFPFSFCLIARNEEKTLPRLLSSIDYFLKNGGECIIVDTWSTDNTAQVARDMGCIVHEVGDRFRITIEDAKAINDRFIIEWEEEVVKDGDTLFDFAAARNFAASLSSNDMIAMPDADEVYTTFKYDVVSQLINDWVEQLEYNFVFSHDEVGDPVIQFMHCKFYNRTKLHWEGVVHEVLQWSANRKCVWEDIIKLEHFQNHDTQRGGYLKWLAVDCFQNPDKDRQSHYFARELLWTWRNKSAIKEFERHLSMWKWPAERGQSMIYIWQAHLNIWNDREGIEWFFKAYMEDSGRREPLMRIAEYYRAHGEPMRVASMAKAMLEIPLSNYYANFADDYTFKPHLLLAWAYYTMGDMVQWKAHYDIALWLSPFNSYVLHDCRFFYSLPKISILIPTLGREEWLKKVQESINKLNYPQDLIETIIIEDKPRKWVPKRVKEMYKKSTWDFIVYAANDMEFHYNSIIIGLMEMNTEKKELLAFNTWEVYPDEGNICEHFIVSREFIDEVLDWEIFDIEFHHVGVDNLLWAKAKKVDACIRSKNAIVYHHHLPKIGKTDDVYDIAYSHTAEDRELLSRKLLEL